MMTRASEPNCWMALPWVRALDRVLRGWEGTPYMHGQQMPGRGVDCVGFVAAVLDELHGITRPLPALPHDLGVHSRAGAFFAARTLLARYPHEAVPAGAQWEPGDILAARVGGGEGPGHALVVGPDPRCLWHAGQAGVRPLGRGSVRGILRAWRPTRRELWA